MTGLVFATRFEAKPFLALSRAEKTTPEPFEIYHTPLQPRLVITVCGMGKVAAAAAAQSLLLRHGVTCLVNAGACGALHDTAGFEVEQLLHIVSALEGDHEVLGKQSLPIVCQHRLKLQLPPARLVTCDRPVFDLRRRSKYAAFADVVDMEGAAIARVAAWHGVTCDLIKGVSDHARPTQRKTLLENLHAVSTRISEVLCQALDVNPHA
ncbi:MAG: hypothetical protein HKP58_20335 [Desulfatitalea sp.]|nr:hypothetical protein [Desulfatitalea sp.]NNK02767.1 hypothetical protein [Desulfatitalea sp.]